MEITSIGERIAKLRNNSGLTQKELGDKLNVSAQAVSKWENGLSEPDIDTLKKLSGIFSVSVSELVDEEAHTEAATAQATAAT
ncbi:MAG: helix-turn-helix domain-containing protein, partial [Candidatus Coproplasma sp.]